MSDSSLTYLAFWRNINEFHARRPFRVLTYPICYYEYYQHVEFSFLWVRSNTSDI